MSNEVNSLYKFGNFRFDGRRQKLWQNDELILLSPKATELLALLLKQNGEFISKEEIFEAVWADTFVEDGVLTQNIYTLRKALGNDESGLPLIENKTRLGYRIVAPVQKIEHLNGNGSANGSGAKILFTTPTEKTGAEISETDSPEISPGKPLKSRRKLQKATRTEKI